MADAITIREDGQHEMAAAEGVSIWWESEQRKAGRLRAGATIDEWQAAAGMDWLIRRSPAQYYADRAQTQLRSWADKTVLYRSDTGAPLGLVSPDYNIVQPYEVLEFFRDMVSTQGFKLETAGTLFGGSQFWALAKVTQAMLSGWDQVGGYVLINTSADGSKATMVQDTTVCVVCNNTLSMALNQRAKSRLSISHRTRFDAPSVQKQLGLSLENFSTFIEAANMLSTVKVSSEHATQFTRDLLKVASAKAVVQGDDEDADDMVEASSVKTRNPRGLDTILELFAGAGRGALQAGRFGTAWGLVNAVTEYVDHHATAKTESHRMQRALWGTGDVLKTMALEKAVIELA